MKTILKFVFLLLLFPLTRETYASANCFYKVEYISPENINEQPLKVNNATYSANTPPSGSFTFLDKQCSSNHIQFTTNTAATTPYSYSWDFGDTFSSTVQNPTHKFTVTNALSSQTFNVTLTLTDTITFETTKVVKVITVITAPDPTLNGTGSGAVFNGMPAFQVNTNAPQVFTFINSSSTIGTNTKYTINWGDGSANFSATKWTTLNHTYAIGTWTALYTIEGPNGCTTVQPFIVFVGLKPTVILGQPAKIDPCKPSSVTFPISGTRNNPPGTTYTVSFNDGSPDTILNHPPPPAIVHSFKMSSCGITSYNIINSFYAKIVAQNVSGSSESHVVPLYISTPLTAECKLSKPITCTDSPVCIRNTSKGGIIVTAAGCEDPKSYWSISPSVGVTLSSGKLGNNNGSSNPALWTPGSDEICPQFSLPGTYTITYTIGNSCSSYSVDKVVCVEAPLVPTFSLPQNQGCNPMRVTATSTTDLTNKCTVPLYQWSVVYTAGYCGSSPSYKVINDTTPAATFDFNSPGTYHITLAMTNTCGQVLSAMQDVIVKSPPTVIINDIPDYCSPAAVTPSALVNSCAPATEVLNYQWEFPGGIPATSMAAIPGVVNYATPGTYTVKLTVSNNCGISAQAIKTFKVNVVPVLTNPTVLSQNVCSGFPTSPVTFTADIPTATFTWSAVATPGITGFTPSGTGNLPTQIITTTDPSLGAVIYSVTPWMGSCAGTTVNYTINVTPQPVLASQSVGDDVCLNGTPKPLKVVYAGATPNSYQWFSNTTNSTAGGTALSGFGANTDTYHPSSSSVGAVYYYCVLNIPGVCTTITSKAAKVTVAPMPTPDKNVEAVTTICEGGTIPNPLTMTYTGGAGNVTYDWYVSTTPTYTGTLVVAGGHSATYTPPPTLSIGSHYYYVVISFAGSGCTPIKSDIAEVKVVPDPTVTDPVSLPPVCQYETPTALSVTASGGIGSSYNYQWYSNTVTNNSGGDLIDKATGHTYVPLTSSPGKLYYYCVVTQPGGCDATSNYAEVEVVEAPTFPPLMSKIYCVGDTPTPLVVTVAGGTGTKTYQWYSNTTNSLGGTKLVTEISDTFTPPIAVASDIYYYCEISFSAGTCTKIYTNIAKITVNDYPVITNKTRTICSGEPFLVIPSDVLPDIVPSGTTYTWTVLTTLGSVTGESNQPSPVSSISQMLTNDNTTASTVVYTVTPTAPGGCSLSTFTITVNVHPAIVIVPIVTSRSCFGKNDASIVVTINGGTGPYSTKWSSTTGFTATNTNTIIGISPSDYTVEVTDGIGCKQSATYTVTEPTDVTLTTNFKKDIKCFGDANGEIDMVATGGSATTYSWTWNGNPYSGNTGHLVGLSPGVYVVTVSDPNVCIPKTSSFTITQPAAPLVVTSIVSQVYDCVNPTVGSIDITPSGGTPPYSYVWSNTATTQDLVNVPPGNYTVTVTDANGCPFSLPFTIIQPLPITINVNFTDEFDCASQTAYKRSVATVTGGFAPYLLTWSRGAASGALNEIMTTSQSGSVNLHVSDAKGCQADYTYNLDVVKPELQSVLMDCRRFLWEFTAIDPNANGQFYSYNWDFGDGTTSTSQKVQHSYANPGTYNVILTMSSATCPAIVYRRTVVVEPLARLSLGNTVRLCEGDSVTQRVIGGTFTKLWSNYSTKDSLVIKQQGNYSVICTSPNGCKDTLNFTVLTDMFNYVIQTDRNELTLDGKPLTMWTLETTPSQYSWDFGDGTFGNGNPITHAYNIVKDGAIEIKLSVTNPYGCTETATKRMWVVNNSLANTFTPNGDGINDVFMPGWNMKVYNRNGILVFEGNQGWDGKYKGQLVSKDTYYYVMDYVTETGAKFKDGYVMVVR
jgi:large repetitive protein